MVHRKHDIGSCSRELSGAIQVLTETETVWKGDELSVIPVKILFQTLLVAKGDQILDIYIEDVKSGQTFDSTANSNLVRFHVDDRTLPSQKGMNDSNLTSYPFFTKANKRKVLMKIHLHKNLCESGSQLHIVVELKKNTKQNEEIFYGLSSVITGELFIINPIIDLLN